MIEDNDKIITEPWLFGDARPPAHYIIVYGEGRGHSLEYYLRLVTERVKAPRILIAYGADSIARILLCWVEPDNWGDYAADYRILWSYLIDLFSQGHFQKLEGQLPDAEWSVSRKRTDRPSNRVYENRTKDALRGINGSN